ncbi:VRR-NUC domain-containing protein [Dyadobacter fermentans]|uniref:VRR-NUC domain-containing protein n=1 Tax=Dyadobacter fermentans TaxID=94254 RepID=UPI001CBB3494|nr:VRR-NUC domain-containing protein [Dyadobacter fermentans]MBZ1361992.1 VRR-NUC domain-containing protein [Dyadobacter fermentans]
MNEKLLERKLREAVKHAGGLALKWVSPGVTGVPDRIIILPGGKVKLVEVKSTGKKQSDRQVIMAGMLDKLGLPVAVIDSQETLNEFLKEI